MKKILIEVSARHIHLSQSDMEALFGKSYQLKKIRDLSQTGEFATNETLTISTGLKEIPNVRIVGPVRKKTQVEISLTDAFNLGLKVPLRISGDIKNTPGINLISQRGGIKIKNGVIVAQRHIHCNSAEAKKLKLKNRQLISVKVLGERSLTFHGVKVRIGDNYKLAMHIDTDEGNAAGINKKGYGVLL